MHQQIDINESPFKVPGVSPMEDAARRLGLQMGQQKPDLRKTVDELIRYHGGHEVIKTVLALLRDEAKAADARQASAKKALELALEAAAG